MILLLAILVAVQTSVAQESETADESEHLAARYSYLKTGDFKLNPEHPPLGKILCALPLLALNPHLSTEHPSWFMMPTSSANSSSTRTAFPRIACYCMRDWSLLS